MFLYNNNYKYYRTIQTVRTAIIHQRSTITNYCNYCTVRTVTTTAASASASTSISSDVAHNSNSTVPIETVVVTLLSPDPYSSRRMMKAIQRLIGGTTYNTDTNIISKININKYNNSSSTKSDDGRIVVVRDQLDESFFPTRNKNWTSSTSTVNVATATEREKSLRWDSVAMQIQNSTNNEKDGTSTDSSGSGSGSSTILHWLSVAIPEDNENHNDESKTTNTTRTNASIKTNNNDKYNNLKNNKYNQSSRMIMEVLSIHGVCYNDDNKNISSNNDSFITIACTDKNTSILSQAVQFVRDKLSIQLMVPTLYESTTTTGTTMTSILSKVFQWTSFTMSTSWLYRNIAGRRPTIRMDHITINGIPIIDFPKQSNSMNETNDNNNFNNVNKNINNDSNNNNMFIPGGLKEVVIPIADDDYNDNDSTTNLQNLFQLLSKQEGLIRSVPGLYSTSYTSTYCSSNSSSTSNNNKHENNILQQQQHQQQQQPNKKLFSIRPLPVAVQDQRLPPPTLIFHIPTVNEQQLYNNQLLSVSSSSSSSSSSSLKGNDVLMDLDDFSSNQSQTTFHKIGFSGGWNGFFSTGSSSGTSSTSSTSSRPSNSGTKNQYGQGQILVRNSMYTFGGLDIRLCSNNNLSSMFNEAQESLLASSLPELQSRHVSGGATTSSTSTSTCSTYSSNNTDTTNDSTSILLTDQQLPKQEQQIGKRGGIVVVSQTSFMSKGINNETNETIVDGDCWKEFRTVAMKNPMGYFWSNRSSSSTSSHTSSSSSSSSYGMTRTMKSSKPLRHRIARAPDLPYE